MDKLIQLASAWAGTLGFALLFNVRGRKLLFASLGGLLAWAAYMLTELHTPNPYLCAFNATVVLTLYAEIMAILQKTPVTVFLVSAAIPLIPGAGLYRAMNCAVHSDWPGFYAQGSYALLFAASMSAGITLTTTVFSLVRMALRTRIKK